MSWTSLRKTYDDQFPALMVSWMLKKEGKLEEELVDKPGTTIGTKFSVMHFIRTPFLFNEMLFLTGDPFVRVSVFIEKLS